MNIRNIIITTLCFLLTGCFSHFLTSEVEIKARTHMELAVEKERLSDFPAALKEVAIIYEKYPDTRFYKTAVWKAVLLNLHPNNSKIDYAAAQDWLQIYLKLPLSLNETEIAVLYEALIYQINQSLDKKNTLFAIIDQQSKNMAILRQDLKQTQTNEAQARAELKKLSAYEAELSILRDKLKKIKEIDVQMHKTKKNTNGKALKSE
jgi:hypothetical protein